IEIDSFNSKDGKLIPIKTTIEQLSSHPIFSRICAPIETNGYNSSLLLSEDSMNGMSFNMSPVVHYNAYISVILSIVLCLDRIFIKRFLKD
ncbi:unnamed protein product, partial [Medioppia subpectinata]